MENNQTVAKFGSRGASEKSELPIVISADHAYWYELAEPDEKTAREIAPANLSAKPSIVWSSGELLGWLFLWFGIGVLVGATFL